MIPGNGEGLLDGARRPRLWWMVRTRCAATTLFLVSAACSGGDGSSGPSGSSGGAVAELLVEGSGPITIEAGERVPGGVTVRARNALGAAVSGAEVVAAGDGQVTPARARTGADGRAVFQWAPDGARVGGQTATFAVGERTASVGVDVRPVMRQVQVLGPSGATTEPGGVLADSVRVQVNRARDGAPLAGTVVRFAVTIGNGALSATDRVTDGQGRAAVQWTLGPALGAQSVRAEALATATAAAASGTVTATALPAALRALAAAPLTVVDGQSQPVAVTPDRAATSVNVVYTYDALQPNVATVSATGQVTAVAVGTTAIRVRGTGSGSGYATTNREVLVPVTVTPRPDAVTALTVSPATATRVVGETVPLSATATTGGTGVRVEYAWSSDQPSIAQVSSTGVVTAQAPGMATIRVRATGDGPNVKPITREATATITVTPRPDALTGLTVSPTSATRTVGQTVSLSATATTGGAGVTVSYAWSSDQPSIAQVSSTGVVTALAPGAATITATATGSGTNYTTSVRSTSVTITVTPRPDALTALTVSPATATRVVGETVPLTASPTTAGAGVTVSYVWSSDQPSIASVSSVGVVTAQTPGTATVRVRATGSGTNVTTRTLETTVTITVTPRPDALTGLTVSPATATRTVGQTVQLTATPTTAGAGVTVSYAWSSDQPSIASVSSAGGVTAQAPGTATIRVRATGSGTGFSTTSLEATASLTLSFAPPTGDGFGPNEFAVIPAGSYYRGSNNDLGMPVRLITISKVFLLQRTEVTQAQWRRVMSGTELANPSWQSGCDRCPVDAVSSNDIQLFLERLNQQHGLTDPAKQFRLPTEAEWEYAARAGTSGDFGVSGPICTFAWVADCGARNLLSRPVAQGTPNVWHIYDMHGNVWERVNDLWQTDYYTTSPDVDPPGPTSGGEPGFRVARGGSFNEEATSARSWIRTVSAQTNRVGSFGFRLARTP